MTGALLSDVVVNGRTIPAAAIAAEAQNHHAPAGKPGLAWRKAARALAIRELLLAEADARGIAADPQETAPGRVETEGEARIRALLDEAVSPAAITEEAVQAEWAKAPERFRAPSLWEVSHILCACEPGDHPAAEAAWLRATRLLAAVEVDPGAFARIAEAESDCGSRANGGALGQLGPGDTVPEFEMALTGLSEGQVVSSPVRTRFGWHLIRLDAVAEGAVLPYEVVRPNLLIAMEKAAWAREARCFAEGLVTSASIEGADIRIA